MAELGRRGRATNGFRVGEPIWTAHPDGPRYGQQLWDIRALVQRPNEGQREIDLRLIPWPYRDTCIDLLTTLARPEHPVVVDAGVVLRGHPAPARMIYDHYLRLRVIAEWGLAQGLPDFSHWTQRDADRLLDDLSAGRHRENGVGLAPSSRRGYIDTLKGLRECSPMLERGLGFMPWGARTAARVAGLIPRPAENLTAPLPWSTWAPAVAAAWAFVDRFSADILAALAMLDPAPARGAAGPAATTLIRDWVAGGGKIPLHTGYGHSTAPRGEPNFTLLCQLVGLNPSVFKPAHHRYQPDTARLVTELAAEPTTSTHGGLITPTVLVTHPDASTTAWVAEIGKGETRYLRGALRAACYIILASLTGMRDSELQDLTRTALSTRDGLPALQGRQFKARPSAEGHQRGWWAPQPAIRAIEVLAALSEHPTHLFTRNPTMIGAYTPTPDIARLVSLVNDPPHTRPGRGAGLALAKIDTTSLAGINATTLRRSLAVYAATRPGAELGLGIQLGHAAWRTTSGYATDGQRQAVRYLDTARIAVVREQAAELVHGTSPVTGRPARAITNFRAQLIADPARAARIIDTLADKLHLGLTNDCMFDPATAACDPHRPHLGDHLCLGSDCANALFTHQHRPMLVDAITRIDAHLDRGRGNPDLIEQLRRNRANLAQLLGELTGTNTDPSPTLDETSS